MTEIVQESIISNSVPFTIKRRIKKVEDPHTKPTDEKAKPTENGKTPLTEEKPKSQKKLGRPRVEWRHREDGTYISKAIDPDYFRKYWAETFKKPFNCHLCDKQLTICSPGAIKAHEKSMHCQLSVLKKQIVTPEVS
jgi:hypothetical protein